MAEKKKTNEFLSEKQELLKGRTKMENKDNQVFARIQSTPLEDQKKLTAFGTRKLKVSNAAASFVPGGGGASALAGFLGSATATGADNASTASTTSSLTTKPAPTNGLSTSTTDFIPGQPTTASKPFVSTQAAPSTQTTQSTTAPGTVASIGITKQPSETNPDGSVKKKLRLGSSAFTIPAGATTATTPATTVPGTNGTTAPATTTGAGPVTGAGAGPVPAKNSPVKKPQNNTISLVSQKLQPPKELGSIAESATEEKQEKTTAGQVDGKKLQKPKEEEKERPKPATKPADEPKVSEKDRAKEKERLEAEKRKEKEEAEKKEKERLEKERLEKEKEEKARLEKERQEAEKKEKEEKERQEAERKKAEAEKKETKTQVKIEIVIMSRVELEAAVNKIAENLKDKRLPDVFERIKAREIILESSRKVNKPGPNYKDQPVKQQIDRNTQPVATSNDSGFVRGSIQKEVVEAPKPTLVRMQLTEEERKKKDELCNSVGVWIKSKKAETDPEEATRKEIKFNLNIITIDNFDVIKEKIHNLAADKSENCRRVAEFIIENAWTQKQYVNTYAKLCDYLGRSERLYFDDGTKVDSKKRKNQFKLHIMKQIQTVFEDESQTNLGFKKPLEEMNKEERSLYYTKKKQRIIGNVSFIGELFLEKFLVIGIVRIITTSLLQKFLDEYNFYQKAVEKPETRSYEDTLEGLLKFYEIIGKTVEEKEAAKPVDLAKSNGVIANFQKLLAIANSTIPSNDAVPKLGAEEVSLEGLFKIFDIVLNQASLSVRLDSLIKNLVHRKENKWVASISKNQGPKTLKEIHEEFEREQMEMERRGDEYREELQSSGYQPRDQGRQQRGGTREVYFQVAQESKGKQAEETKIDMKSINVDTNLTFKPNRGKGDKGDSKTAPKKPRVSFEEIDKELKEVYKIINGDPVEDKGTPEEEIQKLATKFGGKELLHVFYRGFYDGRLEAIKKRLFVPNLLIETKAITEDEFFEEFTRAMHRMFEVACDYPGSDASFATIFLEYCKKIGNLSPLDKISFTKEFYDNEDSDLVLEFYQDFFRAFLGSLQNEYSELNTNEGALKEFAKKIKIEDYEDFKTTI